MNRDKTRSMIERMRTIVHNTDLLKVYSTDLYWHDRNTIEDNDLSEGFIWVLRDSGTQLYYHEPIWFTASDAIFNVDNWKKAAPESRVYWCYWDASGNGILTEFTDTAILFDVCREAWEAVAV